MMFIAQNSQYHPASVDKDPETCWMSRLSVIGYRALGKGEIVAEASVCILRRIAEVG